MVADSHAPDDAKDGDAHTRLPLATTPQVRASQQPRERP